MKNLIKKHGLFITGLAVNLVAIALLVAGVASYRSETKRKIAGCADPRFIQAVPHISGFFGNTSTRETYIYSCADGSTIELSNPIEYYKVKK